MFPGDHVYFCMFSSACTNGDYKTSQLFLWLHIILGLGISADGIAACRCKLPPYKSRVLSSQSLSRGKLSKHILL